MKLNELMEKYGEYEVKEGFMELLEKPKPKNVWDLKNGDVYYFLTSYGYVMKTVWVDTDADNEKLSIGNAFLTEEDAEFARERLKVIAELKKYAKEFSDEDWAKNNSVLKYYIYYNWKNGKVSTNYNYYTSYGNQLLFESGEKAQEAIDAVGEERIKKYYFGVKG
nr:MAG TPA: hypothetical protein [Caudoviricetes sp.]